MFKHFIITRFNIGFRQQNRGNQLKYPVDANTWMEHRLGIFLKYCAPAIHRQTRQDFQWIIIVDESTLSEHINIIQNECDHICVVSSNTQLFGQQWIPQVRQLIRSNTDTEFVITTKLDNDDILHNKFVYWIHNIIKQEDVYGFINGRRNLVVDFANGFSLDTTTGVFYKYAYTNCGSSVGSLLEPNTDELKTVYYKTHDKLPWCDHYLLLPYRAYARCIHGCNLLNFINEQHQQKLAFIPEGFHISV